MGNESGPYVRGDLRAILLRDRNLMPVETSINLIGQC